MTLNEGENLVIMGKSGSGKSVMIKCLIGLERPDSGTIIVMGRKDRGTKSNYIRRTSNRDWLSFQGSAL
jgi:phospholipid/cholesterol/gamma-HCH transport system ATP-binding protein